jgi:hypothetical protein
LIFAIQGFRLDYCPRTHRLLFGGEGMSATRSQFIAAATIGLSVVIGSADPAGADPITAFIFNNTVYEQTNSSAPTTPAFYFFSIGATQTAGDLPWARIAGEPSAY